MTSDAILHAYDLALLQSATRFDLRLREERAASAVWLADLCAKLVTEAIRPDVVLELGAYSAKFSRHIRPQLPDAQIHAFEANPYIHEHFKAEVEQAGVVYHNRAIGEEVKDGVFKIARMRKGKALAQIKGNNSLLAKPQTAEHEDVPVRITTVDHFVSEQALFDKSTVLWIDLEGCAYEGLRGARKTLEQTAILFVEVEDQAFWTGQRLAVDVKRLLIDAGFVPVARDFEYEGQYNLIFARWSVVRRFDVQTLLAESLAPRIRPSKSC